MFDVCSPMLPAFALSFVVVPTMPAVLDGVIVEVACSVVNLPAAGVVVPMAEGEANVAPPSVAALIDVLHANPVPLVHCSPLEEVEQEGTLIAVGEAVEPVPLARMVLAACVANSLRGIEPAGRVTVLEAVRVVKDPEEPLIGVPEIAAAVTIPLKLAPASGA